MLLPSSSGLLFIVSAPSGVGKSTIIRSVLSECPSLKFSVSCTTRRPRADEIPGRDYHFFSREEFLKGIESGRFLEWARVHDNFYGTDAFRIEEWLKAGYDVLLDIDVQGARQVRCSYPQVRTLFILPPSFSILEERLNNRGTETPEQLALRLAAARKEILDAPWFDYVVVNDVLEEAVSDLKAIVRSSRCARESQAPRLRAFLAALSPGATTNSSA
jgi:guanylate kinase